METKRRQTVMVVLGLILIAAFVVLRSLDFYGDPLKWSVKPSALRTSFSFFNCQKNPASLLFLLMTLGPMLILFSLLERPFLPAPISRFLITFGRVPFFFFITHLYLIQVVSIVAAAVRPFVSAHLQIPGIKTPTDLNFDLPIVYFWFIVVMILMYFPCRWFAGIKVRHKNVWWLSHL